MPELFPDDSQIEGGVLAIGGIDAPELVARFGTPLVVYDATTIRRTARAYRAAAPDALIAYGTKAFPNVALLELLHAEGIGADVSTLGELRFALQAGITGEQLVMHGNNKSDEELAAAAQAGALTVLDSLEEVERARAAGARRTLLRVTPGIEADTHEAIRTGHHGSKFGLRPADAVEAIRGDREIMGLHVHIGSQLRDLDAARRAVEWLGAFAAGVRDELGWVPQILDLGGGLGVAGTGEEPELEIGTFVAGLLEECERVCTLAQLPLPALVLEPGRSLVARAGVTLYTVGTVKQSQAGAVYVAVDGGMSDNPRPALYGAHFSALLAGRAGDEPDGVFTVVGKHCETGDLLIDRAALPTPRRGDILAVPATGAYTLAMSSNYNALPRPAAVLVDRGEARVIRRRESIDDLLALET